MAAKNGNNLANGIISLIVLVCGIIFSALIAVLFKKAIEGNVEIQEAESSMTISGNNMNNAFAYASAPLWSFGFAFIVPGLIGLISALTKSKGAYITHMVFCIITLLVMGAFFIFAFFGLGVLMAMNPSSDSCYDVNHKCKCDLDPYSTDSSTPLDYSCDDLRAMYAMAVGIMLMVVIGWILTLVTTILSGILACRNEPQQGVILQRQPMTTTVVQLAPVAGMQPQVAYMPPTNDQAQLVHHMEY